MNVGIRELKAHLSDYVERARQGEQVIVTDRGRPVAVLNSFRSGDSLANGIEEGWIDPPARSGLAPFHPRPGSASVLDVLDDDRG